MPNVRLQQAGTDASAGALTPDFAGSDSATRLAACALAAAFCVHALYDWDWDIPGVTLPAVIALGVLGASGPSRPGAANRARLGAPAGATPARAGATPARVGVAAAGALCLAAFAASVAVPRVAAADAARALVEASTDTPSGLDRALADARRATHLDPLSDAGLRAAATIALHRGDLTAARSALLRAVRRQPSDEQAWQELALTDVARGDRAEATAAARRVAAIDPRGSAP